jgi:hypothetical protein
MFHTPQAETNVTAARGDVANAREARSPQRRAVTFHEKRLRVFGRAEDRRELGARWSVGFAGCEARDFWNRWYHDETGLQRERANPAVGVVTRWTSGGTVATRFLRRAVTMLLARSIVAEESQVRQGVTYTGELKSQEDDEGPNQGKEREMQTTSPRVGCLRDLIRFEHQLGPSDA